MKKVAFCAFWAFCACGISSIVNDSIGEVLYLLRKDPTSTKSTKSDSLHRCFYAHKKHKALNKRFTLDAFRHTKSTKSIER